VVAQAAAPQRALAGGGQLGADLLARGRARVTALDQALAGAEDQALHLARLTVQDRGGLRVREVLELGEQQRGALVLG
jgi:hypothetical protein